MKAKADILFVHSIDYPFVGIMAISAVLKANGHTTDLLISSSSEEIARYTAKGGYPFVGFTTMIGEEALVFQRAQAVKMLVPRATVVLGGIFPTLRPEDAIKQPAIDCICRGEGEYPTLELLSAYRQGLPATEIPNLWFKHNGVLHRNQMRPLNNIDSLPPVDIDLYRPYPHIFNNPTKSFVFSRGCPFSCSFCYNANLRDAYRGLGTYVRIKSPVKAVEEIRAIQSRSRLRTLFLMDDSFLTSRTFLREFSALVRPLGIRIVALGRADQVDEETVEYLVRANVRCLLIAIESGDEHYRNEVMKKKISDASIVRAVSLLKARKILVVSLNMVALPGQTVDMALHTIDLNISAGVNLAFSGFYCPYPGVPLSEYARQLYSLNDAFFSSLPGDYTSRPILPVPDADRLLNIQRLTLFTVRFPVFRRCLPFLIKLPPNPLFGLVCNLMRIYAFKQQTAASLRSILVYAISYIKQRILRRRNA